MRKSEFASRYLSSNFSFNCSSNCSRNHSSNHSSNFSSNHSSNFSSNQYSRKAALNVAIVSLCGLLVSGCAHAQNSQVEIRQSAPSNQQNQFQPGFPNAAQGQQSYTNQQANLPGDAEAIRAQNQQLIKVPITVTAPVKKMLRYDDRGVPHEKFLLQLSNGSTILVAHNTQMAPFVPIQAGDIVTVSGEFIWNAKGGLIHWTHHTDTPKHAGGYIDFNGKRYE